MNYLSVDHTSTCLLITASVTNLVPTVYTYDHSADAVYRFLSWLKFVPSGRLPMYLCVPFSSISNSLAMIRVVWLSTTAHLISALKPDSPHAS